MNWITNYVRPKFNNFWQRKEMPENLWIKCPETGEMVFHKDLEANLGVIPNSGYHMRISAKERLTSFFDGGKFKTLAEANVALDPLKFRDQRKYTDRLRDARIKTGMEDAVLAGQGEVSGIELIALVQDFNFMGGSLGMAAGEGIITAMEFAVEAKLPFVLFAASGGARMQEGILSLMQLPRTTVAVERLKEAGLPYIVVMTNPTTGGVTASYAMLGDVHIAEPGALIGFAGPRVIEQTIREKLPEGFQRAEYLLEHGMVDMVVPRHELKATISNLISILLKNPLVMLALPSVEEVEDADDKIQEDDEKAEIQAADFRIGCKQFCDNLRNPLHGLKQRLNLPSPQLADTMKTDALIKHLSQFHPKGYDLSLGRISELLAKLGQPQDKLPPIFHVAGTNGKGSVIANLRAILEAGNYSVHTHTSPHLVNYHERYRIAHGKSEGVAKSELVSDDMLVEALGRVADANSGDRITVFELLAATMFILFSEQPADYAIVEVGLGGRLDGTNVINNPLVSIITTISLDHQTHLGNTIAEIAFEKAGIIKPGCPVVIGPQRDEAREVLENIAIEKNCPMLIARQDFDYYEEAGRFIYQDADGLLDLPMPNLRGEHQLANSATAIAATRLANCGIDEAAYENAMREIYWPGRFEPLQPGKITSRFASEMEIWIDGGHNAGAGEAIAHELKSLNAASPKNLIVICAMLNTKNPQQYFAQFSPLKPRIFTVPITTSEQGITAHDLASFARSAGLEATACEHLDEALLQAGEIKGDSRLLIAGSLYLVGEVLKKNGTTPK